MQLAADDGSVLVVMATSSAMVWFGEQLAEARRPGWPRGPEIAATDRHGRREGALRGGPHHDERPSTQVRTSNCEKLPSRPPNTQPDAAAPNSATIHAEKKSSLLPREQEAESKLRAAVENSSEDLGW